MYSAHDCFRLCIIYYGVRSVTHWRLEIIYTSCGVFWARTWSVIGTVQCTYTLLLRKEIFLILMVMYAICLSVCFDFIVHVHHVGYMFLGMIGIGIFALLT